MIEEVSTATDEDAAEADKHQQPVASARSQ